MSSASLKRVDNLTITFLVDNCIEWFTKLPPGFTLELPQHLRQFASPGPQGVPVIDLNKFCCGAHGFSALISTEVAGEPQHLTLFDTGPDSLSLVRNVAAMKVPVDKIERVVVSHWHSDHSGGLISFLDLRKDATPCIVDVHPNRPLARGIAPGPTYTKVIGALAEDPTFKQIQESRGVLELHSEGHSVAGDTVWVSGEIPRVTSFENGILGGMRWFEDSAGTGKWTPEQHIMDERYAAVDVSGKGLVIFSACSHAGIVNVVKDAIATFSRPIYMVVGGLHLAPADSTPSIAPTVNFLSQELKPAPTYILPMHCSGFQCKVALEKAFGDGCVPAGVGMRVEVAGIKEDDKRLFPPVY